MPTVEILKIDLEKYKAPKSSLYTGRPQGVEVRKELKLNDIDQKSNVKVIFVIPANTTSINPSFYLGLLYDSYKNIGFDNFFSKYDFEFKTEDQETKTVLIKNIEDGQRYAYNELNKKTGLFSFIKK